MLMNAAETANIEELKAVNSDLTNENEILKSKVIDLDQKIEELKDQMAWFRRNLFGKRSERLVRDLDDKQLYFEGFEPPKEEPVEEGDVKAHKRSKDRNGKDKIKLPADMPVETTVLDIPEDQKVCPETGKPLVKIGESVTHKLAYRPASYFMKEIIRPKYGLPNGEGVVTAELPDSIISRCRADESLLAKILVDKFGYHLPLYRQQDIMTNEGKIFISKQTLSNWVLEIGEALEPLFKEMYKKIIESGYVYIDETTVKLLAKEKAHTAYMWTVAGGKEANPAYRTYHFRYDRKHHWARELLKGYQGVVHSDKYQAYSNLADKFIWCPCWAHIRRKFFELKAGKKFRKWILKRIRDLFLLERKAWELSPEERLKIRKEKEEPIIDEILKGIKERSAKGFLPKSNLGKAINYVLGAESYLKNYLNHPYARIDNNVVERAERSIAIGRKNWMFVGSERGGKAAGIIMSLVQTCRALGINPYEYLEDILRRIMGHSANKLEELLPDRWAASRGLITA